MMYLMRRKESLINLINETILFSRYRKKSYITMKESLMWEDPMSGAFSNCFFDFWALE